MREDELDITIRVVVRSEVDAGVPASADGIDPPTAPHVDILDVCWIQWPEVNIDEFLTQDHIDKIIDHVLTERELGR